MANINIDLVRGHIDTIILKSLSDSPKYGLQILEFIKDISNNMFSMKQPTLYTCLKRLEKLDYIESFQGEISKGAPRLYYKLTAKGINFLIEDQNQWEFSRTILDKLLSDKTFDPSNDTMPFDPIDYRPLTKRSRKDKNADLLGNETIFSSDDSDYIEDEDDLDISPANDFHPPIQNISTPVNDINFSYLDSSMIDSNKNCNNENYNYNKHNSCDIKNSYDFDVKNFNKYSNNDSFNSMYKKNNELNQNSSYSDFSNNNTGFNNENPNIDQTSSNFQDNNNYNGSNYENNYNFADNNIKDNYNSQNHSEYTAPFANNTQNNHYNNVHDNESSKTKTNGSFLNFSEKLMCKDFVVNSNEEIDIKADVATYKILNQLNDTSNIENILLTDANFSPDLKSSKKGVCLGENEKDSTPKMNIIFDEKMFNESRQKKELEDNLYRKSSNIPIIHNNGSFLDNNTRIILSKESTTAEKEEIKAVLKIDYKNNGEFLSEENKRFLTDYLFTPEKKVEVVNEKVEVVNNVKKKNDGQYIGYYAGNKNINISNIYDTNNRDKNNGEITSDDKNLSPNTFGHSFVNSDSFLNSKTNISGQEALNKHIFSVQSKNNSQYITKDRFFNLNDSNIDSEISKKAVSTTFPSMGHNRNYKDETNFKKVDDFYANKFQDYVVKNNTTEKTEIKSFKKISIFKKLINYFADRKSKKIDMSLNSLKHNSDTTNNKNGKISELLYLNESQKNNFKDQTLSDMIYENKLNNIVIKKQIINTNQSAFGSKKYYSNLILFFSALIMAILTSIEVVAVHFLSVGKFSNKKILFVCLAIILALFILILFKYLFYPNKTYFSKIQWSTPVFAVIILIINTILITMIIAFVHIKIEINDFYQMMRYIYIPIMFSLNFPIALFIYFILYKSKKFHYISWRKK